MDGISMSLAELGIPFERVDIVASEGKFVEPKAQGKRIYYGSTTLCNLAIENDPAGLFFDRVNFQTSTWIKKRPDMLNADARVMSLEEAVGSIASTGPFHSWFLRPNNDLKDFSGFVDTAPNICKWFANLGPDCSVTGDTEVIFAETKKILFEMRCFVIQNKIIDASVYRHGKYMRTENLTKTALILPSFKDEFIEQLNITAAGWQPHDVCTMDICVLDCEETPIKVVEWNLFNGTGFYDHDVRKIVKAVTEYRESN